MITDPKQQEELDKLRKALAEQNNLPVEELTKKVFDPKTGEYTLYVIDDRGKAKLTSVNLFGD